MGRRRRTTGKVAVVWYRNGKGQREKSDPIPLSGAGGATEALAAARAWLKEHPGARMSLVEVIDGAI